MTARTKPKALHLAAILSALALTGGVLAACGSSEPAPTPTPTAVFASEDEAFAAAEKVYRAYNDAGNKNRIGADGAEPEDFLIGDALEGYYQGQQYLRNQGVTLEGTTRVTEFLRDAVEVTNETASVTATICQDVTELRGLDESGNDVTPVSRPDLLAQTVKFAYNGESFLITDEAEGDVSRCAAL